MLYPVTGSQGILVSGGDLVGPYGLAFDDSGNLFVGDYAIVKVSPTGAQSVFQ